MRKKLALVNPDGSSLVLVTSLIIIEDIDDVADEDIEVVNNVEDLEMVLSDKIDLYS